MFEDWDDTRLLAAWAAGDGVAGGAFYDRYADCVVRFFENKLSLVASDLTQSTFMRVLELQKRGRIEPRPSYRPFLLGVARNILREHLAKTRRGQAVDIEVDSVATLEPGANTLAGERREKRLLLESLRRLSIQDQMVLELFYWEDLSAREMAQVLDIPPSTMRSRIARARELLTEQMAQIAESREHLASTVSMLADWAEQVRSARKDRDPSKS